MENGLIKIDGMITKWICRLYLNGNKKQISIAGEDKTQQKYVIQSVDDLFGYRDELIKSALRFASTATV